MRTCWTAALRTNQPLIECRLLVGAIEAIAMARQVYRIADPVDEQRGLFKVSSVGGNIYMR